MDGEHGSGTQKLRREASWGGLHSTCFGSVHFGVPGSTHSYVVVVGDFNFEILVKTDMVQRRIKDRMARAIPKTCVMEGLHQKVQRGFSRFGKIPRKLPMPANQVKLGSQPGAGTDQH